MFYYIPKLQHAMLTALICIFLIALCAKARDEIRTALIVGALIFAIMTGVVLWMLLLQAYDAHLDRMIELARLFNTMDEEARQAFAFQFPTMQYRMKRGVVRAEFEDTGVPIETFRLFLQTSNKQQVSPQRDWYTAEKPEWSWIAITEWLKDHDYVIPDSAAGSHSLLWNGNSYEHLFAYWLAGRRIVDMGSDTFVTPPPAEDAGGG